MSERIWKNRCEDCYDVKELKTYSGDLIPDRISVELCGDCIKQRKDRLVRGEKPLPIGLFIDGTWLNIVPVVIVFQDGKRISVAVKFLSDTEYAGIVRLQFPKQTKWLAGGVFGNSPQSAISEAQFHLRRSYFPDQSIAFE